MQIWLITLRDPTVKCISPALFLRLSTTWEVVGGNCVSGFAVPIVWLLDNSPEGEKEINEIPVSFLQKRKT